MNNVKDILEVGQVIKNYKVLCELLGLEIKKGNSRLSQIKDLETFASFNRIGHKYIVKEIYEKEIEKYDARSLGNNKGMHKIDNNFIIPYENIMSKGVYIIKLNNNVYIGSTTIGFLTRYRQHKMNTAILQMEHTKKLIDNGGTFNYLWIASENDTKYDIRKMEQYYIDLYKNNDAYNLINRKNELTANNKFYKAKRKRIATPKTKYTSFKIDSNYMTDILNYLKENNIDYKTTESKNIEVA